MVTQMEKMLEEAWKKFCDYYDTKAPRYQDSWQPKLNERDATESHWICWDEHDLVFHIGRFFYDIKKNEEKYRNIEMHFEKFVNLTNFKDYEFKDKLEELTKKLKMKKGPKVDIIVACEDSNASLLLCAEAKCFRYPTGWRKAINGDIEKLKALKDCKIAQKAVFILFDDYYCHQNNKKTVKKIKDELDKIEKEGIRVLFHTSKAKMCGLKTDC